MILSYLGKTVDLNIPKTSLKLKQHIIDSYSETTLDITSVADA